MARSLNAFYGLLAILPIMGLPMLVGGVTGGEFWRVALGLLNALFFSLAAGIWISAQTDEPQRAMGNTLAVLLLLVAGLPGLVAVVPALRSPNPLSYGAYLSPFYPMVFGPDTAYRGQAGRYWGALVASNALGWLWLGLAALILPRRWQDDSDEFVAAIGWRKFWQPARSGHPGRTRKRRPEWLMINPIFWLVGGDRALRRLVWAIVGVWGLIALVFGSEATGPRSFGLLPWSKAFGFSLKAFGFLLKMCVAIQACRFFTDARRTGSLELLLCTPLRSSEILKGQWLALRQTFLWPFLTFLLFSFIPVGFQIADALPKANLASVWASVLGFSGSLIVICWIALGLLADACAVGWFGMWLALTAKKPNLAVALTILFVLVLPSPFCGLDLLADLFFILWGATRLQQDFRWVINRKSLTKD
jgi:hypothetical protein